MRKTTKSLLWLAVAVVAAAVLLIPRLRSSGELAGPSSGTAVEPLEVEVRELVPHQIVERFSTIGTVQADESVEIRSEISGVLKRILFDEGSRVGRGESLLEIDDVELVAERDRARHRLELAQLRETRQQDLLAQGLTSQEDYDLALSQLNVLQAELRLAQAQLDKARISAPFPASSACGRSVRVPRSRHRRASPRCRSSTRSRSSSRCRRTMPAGSGSEIP